MPRCSENSHTKKWCKVCDKPFCSPDCPHSEAEQANQDAAPQVRATPQPGLYTGCLVTNEVPVGGAHIFRRCMDHVCDADEIWGIPDLDDYIGTMEAVKAEIERRIELAREMQALSVGQQGEIHDESER